MSATELYKGPQASAVLDDAHIGNIRGALGTSRHDDFRPRTA